MKKFFLFSMALIASATLSFSSAQAADAKAAVSPAVAEKPAAPDLSGYEVIGEPHAWGWDFQHSPTEMGEKIYDFHIFINIVIAVITAIVLALIIYIIFRFNAKRNPVPSKTTHNTLLEVIWTVIPILIVVMIIVPSMKLLYYVDKTEKADMTLKVVGYQWYWGYELPDYSVAEFESRLIPTDKLKTGERKLLEVDEPLVLPVGKTVRVLLTGDPMGVIHAWGINSLAFKRDAMPGRINEAWLKIDKPGVYYGQCYELCGVDHAFMPVKVIAVEPEVFNQWVLAKGGKLPVGDAIDANEKANSEAKAELPKSESKESEAKKSSK